MLRLSRSFPVLIFFALLCQQSLITNSVGQPKMKWLDIHEGPNLVRGEMTRLGQKQHHSIGETVSALSPEPGTFV